MSEDSEADLQVFIEAGCQTCVRAVRLAQEVDGDFPQLSVRVVDVSEQSARCDDVFAVPTFVLDDRVLSLGNPQRSHLRQAIESLLRGRGLV